MHVGHTTFLSSIWTINFNIILKQVVDRNVPILVDFNKSTWTVGVTVFIKAHLFGSFSHKNCGWWFFFFFNIWWWYRVGMAMDWFKMGTRSGQLLLGMSLEVSWSGAGGCEFLWTLTRLKFVAGSNFRCAWLTPPWLFLNYILFEVSSPTSRLQCNSLLWIPLGSCLFVMQLLPHLLNQ